MRPDCYPVPVYTTHGTLVPGQPLSIFRSASLRHDGPVRFVDFQVIQIHIVHHRLLQDRQSDTGIAIVRADENAVQRKFTQS